MLFSPGECLSQRSCGIVSALGAVGLAFAPQVLHVLRCLDSAALQKLLCSWVSEKGDNCLIRLDRKENNKQCSAQASGGRNREMKAGKGEILHMYRTEQKKLCS